MTTKLNSNSEPSSISNRGISSADTILVVEDNPDMQEMVRIILENQGYTVLSAFSGQMAIDILKSQSTVSLILLDCRLPDMATSIFLELKNNLAESKHIPVVYFTGDTASTFAKLPEGVVGLIPKPFSIEYFLKTILQCKKI